MGRITANKEILGGKPIIKGTRISVEFVLERLASDVTEDEILQDYPHITKDDILACLEYAATKANVGRGFSLAFGTGVGRKPSCWQVQVANMNPRV